MKIEQPPADGTSRPGLAEVDGVILAAGLSSRMRRPKHSMDLNGRPLLWWALHAAWESALRRVVLVTGPGGAPEEAVKPMLGSPRFIIAVNAFPDAGMSGSLALGLSRVTDARGAMIILGDQPGLSARVVNMLLDVFSDSDDRIVRASVAGRPTSPVLFPVDLFPLLMGISGDKGGRDVIAQHPDRLAQVETGTLYCDEDVDTEGDLERLRVRFACWVGAAQ